MPEEFEQKKEFLQREEVKTMLKDIAKLREVEAQKEKERIAGLKIGEKISTARDKSEATSSLPPVDALIIPKSSPKKPDFSKKILIRAAVVAACFFIFSSLVWFFVVRKPLPEPEPEPSPLPEQVIDQEPIAPEPEPEPDPEPKPEPKPLIIIEKSVNWGHHFPSVPRTIDTIIIHSIFNALGGDVHQVESVIQAYKLYRVATHYLIARDSAVYRLVPDKAIAYHAGYSRMPDGRRVNIVNNFSIGIGLIYTREESPTENQYQALAKLVKELRQKYNIPFENILGHKDISPGRKASPWNFDRDYFTSLIK